MKLHDIFCMFGDFYATDRSIVSVYNTGRCIRHEIVGPLLSPKIHSCVHKGPLLVRILSHMNPVQALTNDIVKIHLNITPMYAYGISF
jgi:hypothetical protein